MRAAPAHRARAVPRAAALTHGQWRLSVLALAAAALAVRLLIIAHTHGGADLRIYTYFGRLALHGLNPFAPPAGGEFPPLESDNPPVEIGLFSVLLRVHDSPVTLRVLFALSDFALIAFVGLRFARPRGWRAAFIGFYAFNPFVLVAWTAFAEDKTLALLLIAIWIWALERQLEWTAWVLTALLTAVKFLGAYAAPVLALDSFRRRRWAAAAPVAMFAASFLAGYVLWFPHSVETFARRGARLDTNPPIHASWTLLVSKLGLYAPIEAKLLTIAAIIAVFALYARRRLGVVEAAVWSVVAGFAFLPNNPFSRLLLVTLALLLITRMTTARWLSLWAIGCVSALAAVVAVQGVPHVLQGVGGALRTIFGRESTVAHVLWMNLLPLVVIGFHLRGRHYDGALEDPS